MLTSWHKVCTEVQAGPASGRVPHQGLLLDMAVVAREICVRLLVEQLDMIWLRENGLTGRDGDLFHAYLRHNFDRDSYLSTQMVRLAEDWRCSQLLGFYETSSKLWVSR